MPNTEESWYFQPSKISKFSVELKEIDEEEVQREDTVTGPGRRNFRYGCENFARIAKISQS